MSRSSRPVKRKVARAGSVAAIAMAVTPFAAAQSILWSASGDRHGDELGYDLTTVADVTGDGILDVAAAAKVKDSTGKIIGTIRLLDGASGAKLFDYVGTSSQPVYDVSDMHDVDGDGVEDFLSTSTGTRSEVWSGRTLKMLYKVADNGDPSLEVGDVDHDGIRDFALGPWLSPNVRVFSGKTGTKLFTIHANSGNSTAWGKVMKALGDVNGDGWPDLLLTDGLENNGSYYTGAAYVYSLKDGTQLTKISGTSFSRFGLTAAAHGDFDQDGITDFAIGAPNENVGSNLEAGAVHIYSGASFSEIARIQGTWAREVLGLDDVAGDIDGDGVPDLALTPQWDSGAQTYIRWIHSGRTMGRLYGMQSTLVSGRLIFSKVFPGVDLDGDGFDEFLFSSNDETVGKLPGTIEAHRGAPSFLTAYPASRPSPLPNWTYAGATDDATFFFHFAGFQPGSLISLVLVEEDGAAASTILFAGNANAMGEQDYAAVFIPPRAGQYTYKVQATGIDTTGASVSTTIEPFEYD